MIIPVELAEEIRCEDAEGWETVETRPINQHRWTVVHEGIYKRLADNTFWRMHYEVGATEYQDLPDHFWGSKEVELVQVKERIIPTVTWVDVE